MGVYLDLHCWGCLLLLGLAWKRSGLAKKKITSKILRRTRPLRHLQERVEFVHSGQTRSCAGHRRRYAGTLGGRLMMGRPMSRKMTLAVKAVRNVHLCERGAANIDIAHFGQTRALLSSPHHPRPPHHTPHTGAVQRHDAGDSIILVRREDELSVQSGEASPRDERRAACSKL